MRNHYKSFQEIENSQKWFCYYCFVMQDFYLFPISGVTSEIIYNKTKRESSLLFEGTKQECEEAILYAKSTKIDPDYTEKYFAYLVKNKPCLASISGNEPLYEDLKIFKPRNILCVGTKQACEKAISDYKVQ